MFDAQHMAVCAADEDDDHDNRTNNGLRTK